MTALASRLDRAERRARARVALRQAGMASGRALPRVEEACDELLAFTRRLFPAYRPADHQRRIAAHLEAVGRGDLLRLIVVMPPRHGKSTLASEHFPAWYLGRNPDRRIIACSHTAGLAYRFSRLARNKLLAPGWPFPGVALASDLAAVQSWDLAARCGGYVAAGVGGAITGHGADLLLVDDPAKSAEEAASATYRDRAWEWWTGTATTRLEPGGAAVVIGTRWHEDDLIGRLLQSGRWTVLHLPALADDDQPLWPERYGVAALERIRAEVGSRNWEAQYQGRPAPAEGAILKREWWGWYRAGEAPVFSRTVQAWDTAYKAGRSNDWSVCTTWGEAVNGYYLLDRYRARVEFPDLKRAAVAQYEKWTPETVLVEDAASGQSLVQELQAGTRLPVVAVRVDRDKIARVNAISPKVEAGKVFLPVDAPWRDEFVEECAAFPFGAHDDQVDSMTLALARLAAPVTLAIPYIPPPVGFVGESTWAGANGAGSAWEPGSGGFGGPTGSGWGW